MLARPHERRGGSSAPTTLRGVLDMRLSAATVTLAGMTITTYDREVWAMAERPTLKEVREHVGSEEWLCALALLNLSPQLRAEAGLWTAYSTGNGVRRADGTFQGDPTMRWEDWIADYDAEGRGWSSTEHRLFAVVASVVDRERPMFLPGVLDVMGSWEHDVWRILTEWGTGGNNKDWPGRSTVVKRAGQR